MPKRKVRKELDAAWIPKKDYPLHDLGSVVVMSLYPLLYSSPPPREFHSLFCCGRASPFNNGALSLTMNYH